MLYAPGGLEAETEQRYLRDGIPLNEQTVSLGETLMETGILTLR